MKLKKRLLKSLIAIVTLISFACAGTKQAVDAPLFSGYALIKNGMQPIDPEKPPTDGVWASWEDAIAISNNQRKERSDLFIKINQTAEERDIAMARLVKTQEELEKNNKGIDKWLKQWGLPVGIVLGFGLGVGIFYAARK